MNILDLHYTSLYCMILAAKNLDVLVQKFLGEGIVTDNCGKDKDFENSVSSLIFKTSSVCFPILFQTRMPCQRLNIWFSVNHNCCPSSPVGCSPIQQNPTTFQFQNRVSSKEITSLSLRLVTCQFGHMPIDITWLLLFHKALTYLCDRNCIKRHLILWKNVTFL